MSPAVREAEAAAARSPDRRTSSGRELERGAHRRIAVSSRPRLATDISLWNAERQRLGDGSGGRMDRCGRRASSSCYRSGGASEQVGRAMRATERGA